MLTKKQILMAIVVTSLSVAWLLSGCALASVAPTSTATRDPNAPFQTAARHTIEEIEQLAGFDVKVPSYLPQGVSLDFATYEAAPHSSVTLHFKLVHETFGDMGPFFQIVQMPQAGAVPNPNACGASGNDCETLQAGDLSVEYRLTAPTESLLWDTDGFSFVLTRTAGEPEKIYKDDLLKVVGSMR